MNSVERVEPVCCKLKVLTLPLPYHQLKQSFAIPPRSLPQPAALNPYLAPAGALLFQAVCRAQTPTPQCWAANSCHHSGNTQSQVAVILSLSPTLPLQVHHGVRSCAGC